MVDRLMVVWASGTKRLIGGALIARNRATALDVVPDDRLEGVGAGIGNRASANDAVTLE
jgi:hypothetical protein